MATAIYCKLANLQFEKIEIRWYYKRSDTVCWPIEKLMTTEFIKAPVDGATCTFLLERNRPKIMRYWDGLWRGRLVSRQVSDEEIKWGENEDEDEAKKEKTIKKRRPKKSVREQVIEGETSRQLQETTLDL